MSIIGSNVLAGASGSGVEAYEIEQSLRFDGSSRFNQTYASSGNRKTFTISFWVKNTTTTIGNVFNQARTNLRLNTTNAAFVLNAGYGSTNKFLTSNASFRDPSAWYHFVLTFDTTQSTESDRVKIWVNNQLQTYSSASYPPQNQDLDYNSTEVAYIGAENTSEYLNGYLAEYHSIDGTALDPTDFGEYDDNGVWRPIEVSLTGPNDGTTWSSSFTDSTGFNSSYPAANAFNGTFTAASTARGSTTNTTATFEPATDIPYTSSVEVWTYYSGSVSLNGGTAVSVSNDQNWRTIATGSGSLDTLAFTASSSTVYVGGIRIDGVTLIDGADHQYGLNGFYLPFDETATNGIGHDHSGNGNNFTATSGFTTSGTGTDVMSDTPTKNWCTLNPLNTGAAYTLANGNLDLTSSSDWDGTTGTFVVSSGKWYYEFTRGSGTSGLLGWCEPQNYDITTEPGDPANSSVWRYRDDGTKRNGESSGQSYGATWTAAGDTIGCSLDLDAGTIAFSKNGTSQGTAYSNLSGKTLVPVIGFNNCTAASSVNFGQREFAHPPGTVSFTDHFAVITYTGDGDTKSLTGCGFQPDLVWIKGRSVASSHGLYDVIRGAGQVLQADSNGVEQNYGSYGLTSFDSDGFSVKDLPGYGVNDSGETYVAWCWKAGGTASSNTDGTLTSSVSANNTSGFSICSYTGAGGTSDFGHGLDTAPSVVLLKNRDTAANWSVYHSALGNTKYINLNNANAAGTTSNMWNDTSPTSSVVHIGSDNTTSGDDFIAYCFAEKSGYSKAGSYTANNSTDGPEVDLGFRPAFLLLKADASANWQMFDSQRRSDDGMLRLRADYLPTGEGDPGTLVFTNTGFRIISADADVNSPNGTTFIYLALSESFVSGDYKALNTANLPAPEIKDGSQHFDTKLYTANSSTAQSITGLNFSPDLLWFKTRSRAEKHIFYDTVRGAGDRWVNTANESSAETTGDNSLTSFDSNGFSLGIDGSGIINYQTDSMVAWAWEIGSAYGFNIVEYTGDDEDGSGNIDVSHGLGVTPEFCIVRNLAGNEARVWHIGLGNTLASTGYPNPELRLTNTGGSSSPVDSFRGFNSTIARFGPNGGTNQSGDQHIAYFWTGVEGFSKFGSYTGNGSTDGPFVYCGFRPAWLLFKRTNAAEDWVITDTARRTYNQMNGGLRPNSSAIEFSSDDVAFDFTANGFKIRATDVKTNGSGSTYIFAAFSENPFGGDGVSPATAR